MKAPNFLISTLHGAWLRKGILSTLLWPISWAVRATIARKYARYRNQPDLTYHSRRPIVVVGNIYVGGTGKTPVVIALVQGLQARGWQPGVVSRGYGVKIGERAVSGQGVVSAEQFGDEPALIAQSTGVPIAVHPQRSLAVKRLQRDYPHVDIIIADDGLQHLALGRDLEVLVQDDRGIGNGRVLPAGPLREPPSRRLYVDFLLTNLRADQADPQPVDTLARQVIMRLLPLNVVHLRSGISLEWKSWIARHGQGRLAAVAAIGQPERFFSMLRHAGIALTQTVALPDHDPYAVSPFTDLPADQILITAKDAVKCGHFDDERIWVVHAQPQFSDPGWLDLAHDMLTIIAKQKSAMAERAPRH